MAVVLLGNVFRNLNGVLAYGTKCAGQVFSAVNGHVRSPRGCFPPVPNASDTCRADADFDAKSLPLVTRFCEISTQRARLQ